MTVTLLIMAVVAAVAGAATWWQSRTRRPAPTQTRGEPPAHLDRDDFRAPEATWLIAVFTSDTCSSCAAVWNDVAVHESPDVVAENVDVQRSPELHRRYHIESVPTAVVVDRDGLARAAFVGPLGPDDREMLRTIVANHD